MDNTTLENLKKIDAIARKGDTSFFFHAIAFLFENGVSSFSEIRMDALLKHLDEKHDKYDAEGSFPGLTRGYEKEIVKTCYDLARFPLFDLLLYIKRSMDIDDPQRRVLTNIHTGEVVGEIDGNYIETKIGTFYVNDRDLEWLITTASSEPGFCEEDVKEVDRPEQAD